MASLSFEDKFISSVLDGKTTFEALDFSNFSTSWLKHRGDMFDWMRVYFQSNNKLPDQELAETRFPDFQYVTADEAPAELISALNNNSLKSRLFTDLQEISRLLQTGENPANIIARTKVKLAKYEVDADREDDVYDFTSPSFVEGLNDFKDRQTAFKTNGLIGIPTGLGPEFDVGFLNGGLYGGMLYGAVGISGIGKSWIAQVHGVSALNVGQTPMYVALEGIAPLEYYRFLTIAAGISNAQQMSGSLPEEAFLTARQMVLQQAAKDGTRYLLAVFGKRNKYTSEILHKKIIRHKPKLVIVDYAQMMEGEGNNKESKWQMLLDTSRDLKIIAGSENIPIVAILQGDIFAENASELSMGNVAGSKGMPRDFDFMWGYTKVKGKKYIIRVNAIKGRFSEKIDFKALYRTNWDTGKISFVEHITEETLDGEF